MGDAPPCGPGCFADGGRVGDELHGASKKMLGLTYRTVRLQSHAPAWARAFRLERERLAEVLAAVRCRIEHVGSTAVADLDAKPILDIAVGVAERDRIETSICAIETLGYLYRGDAGSEGGHVLVRETRPGIRTHHVHVVTLDDPQWDDYLTLRDHLRRDAAARDAYARTKRGLAARYAADRAAYSAAKREIVQGLLAEARRDATRRLVPPNDGA